VGGEIEQMRTELAQAVSAAPAAELPNPTEFDAALDEEEGRGDDYYASLEQQRQTELMHEQDEQLDGVFRTVGNLRQQANDMGRELEDQAVMIEEVDTLADRVGGKLNNGMARIRHIVRQNEGKQYSRLVCLICSAACWSGTVLRLLVYVIWNCAVWEQMGIMKFSKLTFSSPP
jgi:t-SNARE syntaxin family protein